MECSGSSDGKGTALSEASLSSSRVGCGSRGGPAPSAGRHRPPVLDGSAVSANPGVNPALTICALAERAMSLSPPAA